MSSETKWTRGPWAIEYAGHEPTIIGPIPYTSDQRDIAYVNTEVADKDGFGCAITATANAHLIAAAPELYGRLEYLLTQLEFSGTLSNGEEMDIRKTLAKARGEGIDA